MAQYEIKDVVCDYGLYEDGELKLILNSAHNAHLVKRILEIDQSVPNSAIPADFVEVVRCKDCKHRVENCKMCAHPKAIGWDAIEPEDDDFCSYGERKEK